jgi:branched-chain amino acid aminotransferase
MMSGQQIPFTRSTSIGQKPRPKNDTELGFGKYFTDHMFLMDYERGKGWHNLRIEPYGPIPLDPSAMVLHYGQEVFEGLKACCISCPGERLHPGSLVGCSGA